MKTIHKALALTTLCIISFSLTGCRGSAGKKAATKTIELIKKKGGASKAATTIEREAPQMERNAVREAEGYNTRGSRTYRPRYSSYDEDESSYQPHESSHQPPIYSVQCSQCGGSGMVYIVDFYGNIQYDYYGNPVISQCPSCGGIGFTLVPE